MNSTTSPSAPPTSIPALLRDLRDETTTLLRQEVDLAKTELKQNAVQLGNHVLQIAIGGFVAYAGVIVLLIGIGHLLGALMARAGLDEEVAQWLAPSLIGFLVGIIGWAMIAKAKKALSKDNIVPRQALDSLRDTKGWAQTKLHTP